MTKEELKGKEVKAQPAKQPQAVPPPPPPGSPGRKRPFLASILSIIIMVVGIFTILAGLIFIAAAGILIGFVPFTIPATQFIALFGVLVLLLGLLLFATGVGLWKLKKWALYLVGLPVVIYLGILGVSAGMTGGFALALVCAPVPIIAIVLLLYLVSIRKRFF